MNYKLVSYQFQYVLIKVWTSVYLTEHKLSSLITNSVQGTEYRGDDHSYRDFTCLHNSKHTILA